MGETVSVSVVAPDPLLEAGTTSALHSCPDVAVGMPGETVMVTVVIVDDVDSDVLDLVRATRAAVHRPEVVLVATDVAPTEALHAIAAGARGLLRRREASAARLTRAVLAAASGDCTMSSDMLDGLLGHGTSEREHAVPKSQRQVFALHSMRTLRETHDAAGPNDSVDLMHVPGCLPANGMAAQHAYTGGFLEGQNRLVSVVNRVQDFTRMLLERNPAASSAASGLGFSVAPYYLVTLARVPSPPFDSTDARRDEVVDSLFKRYRVPVLWHEPEELIALLPTDGADALAKSRALLLVRDFASMIGRTCSTGAASGRRQAIGSALTVARQISRVTPIEAVPRRVHVMSDTFVELGAARTPDVEEWLRGIGQRLAAGPDLVTTLDVFYEHGMNRLRAAGALHIHPRTLDYRLRRVGELTGLDPGSVQGVRTFSATVSFLLSGT